MEATYVDIDRLIETFLSRFTAEGTRTSYAFVLRHAGAWLAKRHLNLLEVAPIDLERYFQHRSQNVASATLKHGQVALNSFYSYAVSEGVLRESPMASIEMVPHTNRSPGPTGLTQQDILAIISVLEHRPDRDASMVLLLLLGGFRLREVLDLNVEDVKVSADVATITIRGRKVGSVQTLPPIIAKRLTPLVDARSSGPLFVTKEGHRYTRFAIRDLIARVAKWAGIQIHLSPQVLRTAMFETSFRSGANPAAVADAAGIEDLRAFTYLLPLAAPAERHPAFLVIRTLTDPGPLEGLVHQVDVLLEDSGVHPVAPILVSSALLEARLRSLVQRCGLSVSGKGGISKYADALKQGGAITEVEWRELQVLGARRNEAAHGDNLEKLTHRDAQKMAEGVAEFLQSHP